MSATNNFLKFDYKQFNRKNLAKIASRFGDPEKLTVLYISTYHPNYTRTESVLTLFAKIGLQVKVVLTSGSRLKYVKAICDLIRYGHRCGLIFVAFRSHEILPVFRMLTRKPIIFDAFVSVYDTLCLDREVFQPDSLPGKCLKAYDKFLCRISDIVLVDTRTHKEYFEREFDACNVDYLYLGCNEELFKPVSVERRSDLFTVFWYGTANPLQGVDVLLKAAKLLEDKAVTFRLVGPVKQKYGKLLTQLDIKNAELIDSVPYEKLPMEINKADVCLGGHFSAKDKAKRVIAGKTFQFLSCGRPTIVGDSPANRELLMERDLVHFVAMNNPDALAAKIMEVKEK